MTRAWTLGIVLSMTACSSGSTSADAGTEAGSEASAPTDSGNNDDGSTCTTTLCVQDNTSQLCPSCAVNNGDTCSPPAAITCVWNNGCTGPALQSRQCTCELPDASADANDASSGSAVWSCQ